jgi:2-polyprenyl-6-methoxyphenol hydroxylase-like FAD-dependent oxidoreductase
MTDRPADRPVQCTVVGGSLVGLSAAIALSRLGLNVTVAERSPARAVDGGGGLGVDVDLLREVTGIGEDPPMPHGIDRDTTAWHLPERWLEEHAARRAGVTVRRGIDVITATTGG